MSFKRWAMALMLLCAGFSAGAQQDPPDRVARLTAQQGHVSFSPAGDTGWYDVIPNRPLATGDRIRTDRSTQAEFHVGSTAVRLDEQTQLELSELGDQALRVTLQRGSVQVRVRDDMAGERVEFGTANFAVVLRQPGQYQVETDPATGLSQLAVAAGSAVVYGDGGESRPLAARQQLAVSGRDLTVALGVQMATNDFERWVAERNRAEDQSVSARYVSREIVGYQQLDAYGDWQNETAFGAVWYPRRVDADWAPYREGSWVNVAPWGLTWIDSAPWGFAPSHYGRWARIGARWGWVPGQPQVRPVYAPALVGFIGGGPRPGTLGVQGGLPIGNGRSGVGWFPLAPGEAWRPDYQASQRYIDRVNRMTVAGQPAPRQDGYVNQRRPESVTVVPADVFGRGPINRRDTIRLPQAALAGASAGTAPPLALPQPFAPGIGRAPTGFAGRSGAVSPQAGSPAIQAMPVVPALQPDAMRPQAGMPPPLPHRTPSEEVQQREAQRQQMQQQLGQQQRQAQEAQAQQQMQQQAQAVQQASQQQQALRQAQENQQRAHQMQMQTQQQQIQQQQVQETQQRAAQQQMQQQQRAEARQQSSVRPAQQPGTAGQGSPVYRDRLRPSDGAGNPSP